MNVDFPSREALSRVVAMAGDGVTEEREGWFDGAAKQDATHDGIKTILIGPPVILIRPAISEQRDPRRYGYPVQYL